MERIEMFIARTRQFFQHFMKRIMMTLACTNKTSKANKPGQNKCRIQNKTVRRFSKTAKLQECLQICNHGPHADRACENQNSSTRKKILSEICLKMVKMEAYFSHSDSKKLETIGFRRKKHEFAQKSKYKNDAKMESKMSKIHRKTRKSR